MSKAMRADLVRTGDQVRMSGTRHTVVHARRSGGLVHLVLTGNAQLETGPATLLIVDREVREENHDDVGPADVVHTSES